jgi:hypothetical protein
MTAGTGILRPRFIALDSSHLVAIAGDKLSQEKGRRNDAKAFEDCFDSSGCLLLLSWHHFEEILRHRDDAVVADRIAYIQSLPVAAWVSSFHSEDVPGSIVDIHTYETAVAFDSPHAEIIAVRDEVAKRLVRLGKGARAIKPFLEEWNVLRPMLWEREERERELVAISTSDFVDISRTRAKDWLKGAVHSPEEAFRRLGLMGQRLTADIRTRGDRRIPDAGHTAAGFFDDVIRESAVLYENPSNPALEYLRQRDIDPSEIGDETTMGEICAWATFRHDLRVINRNLGLPWPELKARVTEGRIPSGVIQSALREHGQKLSERKGSELTDRYLACLSPYADITYVDKRTHENFLRAKRKLPELAALVRNVQKAAHYREIAKHLVSGKC